MRSGKREERGRVSGRMSNKNRANERHKKDKRTKLIHSNYTEM
jgi:hypothetical protein